MRHANAKIAETKQKSYNSAWPLWRDLKDRIEKDGKIQMAIPVLTRMKLHKTRKSIELAFMDSVIRVIDYHSAKTKKIQRRGRPRETKDALIMKAQRKT